MKGLLLKDWYMVVKYCKAYLLICLVFIGVSIMSDDNFFFILYPCILCGMIPVTLLGYDERSKWDQYCAALPYTKAQIVSGKYLLGMGTQIGMLLLNAVILAIRFSRDMELPQAVYYGIFHSISAFCNAGFDLMGKDGAYISLTQYSGDWVVNLVIMLLIIIGGIGFFIWGDISENQLHFRKYRLHTKITILMTLFLIFGGAVILFILEYYNTIAGRPLNEQILCSLFGSVTARTAVFNTVDTGALTDSSKLVTILLMFIGGSPGSTAGGIKTTTAVVLIAHVYAGLFDKKECSMFGRRIGEDAVRKASTVLCTNLMLCAAAVVIIVTATSIDVTDVMFEVASAMGTVGMSAGITRDLDTISKLVLIFLMFCGRVGSFTFALSMKGHKVDPPVKLPEEEVMVG